MSARSSRTQSEVYRHPRYYAIGYRWNTGTECDFIESCLKAHGPKGAKRSFDSPAGSGVAQDHPERAKRVEGRLLDIGCGSGRHLLELAQRGYQMTGMDVSPEMVAYVMDEAKRTMLPVKAAVGDLRQLRVTGTFDAAYCFMDTFRFLLTNNEIIAHLRAAGALLAPGGLYLTDFWVPSKMDMIGNEIHQWEQTDGDTTVRVFYLQHPETIDPITQTFDDELVFAIEEPGGTQEIRGGATRTRLLLPQEFAALVEASGAFRLVSTHGEFDLAKPFDAATLSWRMISVLQKR